MTDPDEPAGSAADRRFREALREGLAAAERESQGEGSAAAELDEPRGDRPVLAPAKPPRARSEVFMDWAPLAVGVLAIVAVVGIALYGINGGDLGPW
ncbi:hypothetical protein [Frigoribacterium sp. PvP032]|uniref:hypothetical protein n=1 Tax=Frigoribacterium sp. PvP032 TaxID=2806589 RepID=UPI001AE257BB|nr:hypothetical protein [Frigoribacterium sp. PvP032]MBP1189881.1 hypothetical protein [Frigoribacterium sp. PvP032]